MRKLSFQKRHRKHTFSMSLHLMNEVDEDEVVVRDIKPNLKKRKLEKPVDDMVTVNPKATLDSKTEFGGSSSSKDIL